MNRYDYYLTVMQPLQRPLLEIGAKGMPIDELAIARHKRNCVRRVAAATKLLVKAGRDMLDAKASELWQLIGELEKAREAERTAGTRKFSRGPELTKARNKLKACVDFNPDSAPQRTALLYEWYGLPPIKNKGAKGFTSDDTAVEDLLSRLERDTIKPKRGTKKEVMLALKAMVYVKKWSTLDRAFLRPELR